MLESRYGEGDLGALDAVHSAPRGNRWTVGENVEGGEYLEGMRMWEL